jgi:hypothetical protein
MASKKRQVADAKAKAKKQKFLAIGGSVMLLAILAFEIPNTLKLMKQTSGQTEQSVSQSAATTTTVSTTPAVTGATAPVAGSLTPPTLSGPATASQPASSSGLANSDPAPAAQDGQLAQLDRFAAKDPFAQQVAIAAGGDPTKPGTGAAADGTATTGAGTTATPTPPSAGGSAVPSSGATGGKAAAATKATISINGASEDVQVGGTVPAVQPYFQLVSLTATSAKVGIAGGSLAGGSATVTLVKGKKLTLQNTADGTRYVLILVAAA